MRIISGIAKGKKIFYPIDKKTRPLKDLVRESIFNIIVHSKLLKNKFNNTVVLDLFSGVGSFGLEAISRGAKKVVFFENYNPAIKLLVKNINNLSFDNHAEVNKKDIYNKKNLTKLNSKFDLIFLDPPFKDTNLNNLLQNIEKLKLIVPETLIVMHRHKKTNDEFDKNLKVEREKIYGSSKIIFAFFNF